MTIDFQWPNRPAPRAQYHHDPKDAWWWPGAASAKSAQVIAVRYSTITGINTTLRPR